MSKSPRILDIEKVVHGNKVKTDFIAAPFTQIKNEQGNPRKIADLGNNLKASMGVERIMFNSIKKLDKEFGPAGQIVHELSTKDARVRFVGDWITDSPQHGNFVKTATDEDFIEVTFYGTGLNILIFSGASADYRYAVDGGSESSNFMSSHSTVLSNRSYKENIVQPVVSGLSLDMHTIKVKMHTGSSLNFNLYGVEIVNESTQLAINPGQPFIGGLSATLDTQTLLDYSPASLAGTKGGRVLTYLTEEGVLGQSVTLTDPQVTTGNPAELVTNGTFDSDISGWRTVAGSWNAGRARVNSGGGAERYLAQEIAVTPGQKYTLIFEAFHISNEGYAIVTEPILTTNINLDPGSTTLHQGVTSAGQNSITFTPTLAQVTIMFGTAAPSFIAEYDNISVKETAYNFLALGDTDHSNEEIVRTVNFREFGRNRGDDFSTISGLGAVSRAFTLDDGTTTLTGLSIGQQTNNGVDCLISAAGGQQWILTFCGTGLDVEMSNLAYTGTAEYFVDGVGVGTIGTEYASGRYKVKICSGLPYGTHTVTFSNASLGGIAGGFGLTNFILYQPKEPTLPESAVEVSDYNVMADFVQNSTSSIEHLSTGLLRKCIHREMVFIEGTGGTVDWGLQAGNPGDIINGTDAGSNRTNCAMQYTFFGTGCELRWGTDANRSTDSTITLNGTIATAANFPTATYNVHGTSAAYNDATASLNMTGVAFGNFEKDGFSISGLPLDTYTFRISNNDTGNYIDVESLDIITPIHINSKDMRTGSLSLQDLRKDNEIKGEARSKIDMSKAKALLMFDATTNQIKSSYNISAVIDAASGHFNVYFKKRFKDNNYIVQATGEHTGGGGSNVTVSISKDRTYASSFQLIQMRVDAVLGNATFYIAVFGELEDEEDIDLGDL